MKFTKLALASVAAFGLAGAATADATPLVADGLDSWLDLTISPQTGRNASSGTGESGAVWFGEESEDTKVTAYLDSGVSTYSGACGHPGGLAAGDNFLKVSNSTTLWRMINSYAKVGEVGSEAWPTSFPENTDVNVGEGLYIDTLVQFTPSEDAPEPESGSKLIVWMNAESNLCVTASKLITSGNIPEFETESFTTTKALEVNTWYRLTVKAYSTVLDDGGGTIKHAFKVLVDGTPVVSSEAAVDTSYDTNPDFEDVMGAFAGGQELEADFNAGRLFLSLDTAEYATLAAVGFRGEGLVDDIVVTTEDPFPEGAPTGIDFTLTWGEGVSAVWYAVGDAEKVAATKDQAIEVAADAVVTITADAADWYAIDASSIPATVADGQTYTITASAAATGGDAGVTGDLAGFSAAELQAAFPDSSPAEINAASGAYLDYQFGQDLGTLSAAPTVEITDIAENATAGWDITVKMFNGETALNIEDGEKKTIKAALKVIQASTLAGLATAEPETYNLAFDSDKTDITINVTAGSFFKAYVEYAVPANN